MQKVVEGTVLGVVAAAIVSVAFVAALLSASQTMTNAGTVTGKGVGVFWDSAGTNKTTLIGWGTLSPGDTKSCLVYVKNVGYDPVTLSMATSAWVPSNASSSISLVWNCTGYVLPLHNAFVACNLVLNVSSSTTGITDFSFNITIAGT